LPGKELAQGLLVSLAGAAQELVVLLPESVMGDPMT
jgi:hypothetical protein